MSPFVSFDHNLTCFTKSHARTIDDLRLHALYANLLGERILEQFPALHQAHGPVSPLIEGLLRGPFPAQVIAIMGLAKRWQRARTGMVVAECGTGKTLISLGAIHVHNEGRPFTALAMVPPHLVAKWAREVFLTLPGVRLFSGGTLTEWRARDYFPRFLSRRVTVLGSRIRLLRQALQERRPI